MRFAGHAFFVLPFLFMGYGVPVSAEMPPSHPSSVTRDFLARDSASRVPSDSGPSDGGVLSERSQPVFLAQVGTPGEMRAAENVPEAGELADPLEPANRAFFEFNDRLYFWVLKPVASTYKKALPEPLRGSIRNFFLNVATPIRMVNCLLQLDMKGVGTELFRLVVNSTMGVVGFGDAGSEVFGVERRRADFGETLGVYGLGPAFYIDWPFLGPSSARDSVGFAGDYFLDPLSYLPLVYGAGTRGYDRVNATSLTLGEYESLKRAALDPYIALRNAYYQYRQNQVEQAKRRAWMR